MKVHRPDVALIDRTKIQGEVLVPLLQAMERELGTDRAHELVRGVLAEEFRQLARSGVEEANGDHTAAFGSFAAYSVTDGVAEVESRAAPEGEIRFDVVSCQCARFFRPLGEPELGFLIVCGADCPIAEVLGIGFERSQTIMQGSTHCDLHYLLPTGSE